MNKATQKPSTQTHKKEEEVTKPVVKVEKQSTDNKEKSTGFPKSTPVKEEKKDLKKDEVKKESKKTEVVVKQEPTDVVVEPKINPKTGKPYGQKRENQVLVSMNDPQPIKNKADERTKNNVRLCYHPKLRYIIIFSKTVNGRVIVEKDWDTIKEAVTGLYEDFQGIKNPTSEQEEVTGMLGDLVAGGKDAYDKLYITHKSEFKSKTKPRTGKGTKRTRGKKDEDGAEDQTTIENDLKKVIIESEQTKLKDLKLNFAISVALQKKKIDQVNKMSLEEAISYAEGSRGFK